MKNEIERKTPAHEPLFAGTLRLIGFRLRRDRLFIGMWIAVMAAMVIGMAPLMENLVFAKDSPQVIAELLNNPAICALTGPVYGADHYTVGAAYAGKMTLYSAIFAGFFGMMLAARGTRQDEEQGRLEMLRSLPVGRLAPLASALGAAVLSLAALSLICGAGLVLFRTPGMTPVGCMLFGAALGAAGFFFAAVQAVLAQLFSSSRAAQGTSIALMLLFYILRAIGDAVSEYEILALISPLGLVLRGEYFVRNLGWPAGILLIVSAALCAIALALASGRDLGCGYFAERPGRRRAGPLLGSPLGLALRLNRTMLISWMIGLTALGLLYGSILGELDRFVEQNAMLRAMLTFLGESGFTDQYLAILMGILALFAAMPCLMLTGRIVAEEKLGMAENLLARSVRRAGLMSSYVIPAALLSVVLMLCAALGLWGAAEWTLEAPPELSVLLLAAASHLPAIWVMIALKALSAGFRPAADGAVYGFYAFAFAMSYLRMMDGFPEWLVKLSPFEQAAKYPAEQLDIAVSARLTAAAALLIAAAYFGYRRRDVGRI